MSIEKPITDLSSITNEEIEASSCGRYQYLRRLELGEGSKGTCTVIGLMPTASRASKSADDQVTKICKDFAASLGYRTLNLVNLYAIHPEAEVSEQSLVDAVGPENDRWLLQAASESELIVCAWGSYPRIGSRVYAVLGLLTPYDLFCVHTNRRGSPAHPLKWKKKIPKIYRLKSHKTDYQAAG